VDQGGGLEGMTADLAPEHPVGGRPKLLIDKRKQAIQGLPVTTPQPVEQLRHFA